MSRFEINSSLISNRFPGYILFLFIIAFKPDYVIIFRVFLNAFGGYTLSCSLTRMQNINKIFINEVRVYNFLLKLFI